LGGGDLKLEAGPRVASVAAVGKHVTVRGLGNYHGIITVVDAEARTDPGWARTLARKE
jgi:hypothetical protein